MKENGKKPNIARGLLVGLIAGLAASWAMNRFQDVWLAVSPADSSKPKETEPTQPDSADESEDNATVKAASAVTEGLFDHKLTPSEKKIAGPIVHYAVGAAGGIAYGIASQLAPRVKAGFGLPYGAAFWLVVDETIVPLLGLSKGPTKYPFSTHVYALASHLVFGATIEGTRRIFRD